MAIATGCVVAGALLTSPAGRSVMSSAASNTAQHILGMVLGTSPNKEKNQFLSSRIQAKLECILHLFQMMTKIEQRKEKKEEKDERKPRESMCDPETAYEHTMWNRVFKEMSHISALIVSMKREQEEDKKSWMRCYWPRSQTQKQVDIIAHLETIEEIIRFVSMVTPYIHRNSGKTSK